jgi:nitroreductase
VNDTIKLIKNRKSVRSFLPDSIDQQILEDIFSSAQHAPSNCNTQPWQVAVVSGKVCDHLRNKIYQAFEQGRICMDFPYDGIYEGKYKQRQHGAAAALYQAVHITREDKQARHRQFMENFRFFGAPHAAFIFIPEQFGIREAADIGMYAQTLMLSMAAYGVGSCPQTALGFCCDLVREELDISPENRLLFGISFGYESKEAPVNTCRTERVPLSESVRFYS